MGSACGRCQRPEEAVRGICVPGVLFQEGELQVGKSQMIKFPLAVLKGFLSAVVPKDGGFYQEEFSVVCK